MAGINAAPYDPMSAVRNDRGIMMIRGAGDPLGIWEVLGIIAASSDNSNMRLAALPLLLVTKNGDDALKLLAAENGFLKAEARAAKLSAKQRPGMDFTVAGKGSVKDLNKIKNNGKVICETCSTETIPGVKSQRGVVPPQNEAQVDHIIRKREGGSGTPDNGQVLCRKCNLDKH